MDTHNTVRSDARARTARPRLSPFDIHKEPFEISSNATRTRQQGETSGSHKRRWSGIDDRSPGGTRKRAGSGLPTAAELFVPSLPGIPNLASHPTHPLQIYAGMLPSYPGEGEGGGEGNTGKDAQLFFLMAKARRSAGKQRLLFWFNGGPGCSSFDGSLMEVGPFRTVPASQTESGQVEIRLVDGGWEEFATVVFIDQPPGTGLSFVPTNGYLHELDQGSAHLIQFLQNFFTVFPELNGVDMYLAGESFAGQYIPYFADAIIKSTKLPDFPLKGIAIGNGWIDPKQQYRGYVDFAYEKGLIKEGTPEAERLDAAMQECQTEIDKYTDPNTSPVNIDHCGGVMDAVTAPFVQELNGNKVCMNIYDVRLVDDYPACGMNWPPDLPDVYSFLRRDDVVSALHATAHETAWVECSNKVSAELHLKHSPAAVHLLPSILEAGVPIMMFAGAEDLICNYKGIERIVNSLEWGGEVGMNNATADAWFVNDTQVGTWQMSRNMTYVNVGFDLPHVTNDMILRFMDVDFSLLPGTAASSPSRVGSLDRVSVSLASAAAAGVPLFKGGKTDWEAWYNAGSAFLILLILLSIVALYFYFRRRNHLRTKYGGVSLGLPRDRDADGGEERVPLHRGDRGEGAERVELDDLERAERYEYDDTFERGERRRSSNMGKGKGRGRGGRMREERGEEDGEAEVVFALGDEEDER